MRGRIGQNSEGIETWFWPTMKKEQRQSFAVDLEAGELIVSGLIRLNQKSAFPVHVGGICYFIVKKEIRTRKPVDGSKAEKYPIFHVYDPCDPSKAFSPDVPFRVTSEDEPFTDLDEAVSTAQRHRAEAIATQLWSTNY